MSRRHDAIDAVLVRHGHRPDALLQILREAQEAEGWIARDGLAHIAQALGLTLAEVEGVSSFYRFLHRRPVGRYRVLFSDNITDHMLGAQALMAQLCALLAVKPGELSRNGLVSVAPTSCIGLCDQGPAVLVNHRHVLTRLDAGRVAHMAELIRAQVPVPQWPVAWFEVHDNVRRTDVLLGTPFEPGSALRAALALGADGVMDELKRSALRGRGGAGYVAGAKWTACRETPADIRYVVCNADEGEPGTFKDRVLLASHADLVFEGMTTAALAVGARQGLVYLRGEYSYMLEPLRVQLQRRRDAGLLGPAVGGSETLAFDIDIHVGAGAYVCGEESSLLESLEGRRGYPRHRPPFPAESGYLGRPTVVNNVETFAAVSHILLRDGAWWAGIGTPRSTGTKIHSVSGDCERPGLYEYPYGTRVAQILQDCGAHDTQAVQVGGAAGVCLAAPEFVRRLAYEDVPTTGAFMVFDRSRDMFEVARNFAHFFEHESCGFCTPCRVGTALVARRMDKLAAGHGSRVDLNVLLELDGLMHAATHCGLGATACNPLRDTIAKFRPAYEKRLKSLHFEPAFDLDAELSVARRMTGRDDAAAHLGTLP